MTHQVSDNQGNPIDAHFDIDGSSIVFHSRGGTKKSNNARNSQYGEGLRIVISRLKDASIGIRQAYVDSSIVQEMPLEKRRILESKSIIGDVNAIFTELSRRMADVRLGDSGGSKGGNPTKKIRIETTATDAEALKAALKGIPTTKDTRSQERLPAEELYKVQPQHIYKAIQRLQTGEVEHPFAESTDYDVLLDEGKRLPPKAVFGLAATEALGFQVKPEHFSAGIGMPCFTIIEAAGYTIVRKGATEPATKTAKRAPPVPAIASDEDREFVEGKKERVYHLKSERDRYAPIAKRAALKAQHGYLFCERCRMKPVEVYGSEVGEACIEVHHTKPIAEMKEGDKTKLEDLQCLCASCHRVVHRELQLADK